MSRLTMRRALPEERHKLLGLLRESFGDAAGHWTEEYWCWKHEANPFGPSYVFVAEDDGRPVGLRVFLRWQLQSGDRQVPAVRAVDTATHPAYRRRGIFSRLTREALGEIEADGVAFVFNTPNARSRPGYLKLGWRDVGGIPLLICPLRPLRMLLPASRSRDHEPSLAGFPTAADLLETPGLDLSSFRPSDPRLHTERTRAYLAWRYRDVPSHRYHTLWAHEGADAAALCFHGRRRRRRREVTLSEVMLTPGPGSRELTVRLLRKLAEEASADYLVAVAARGTRERAALRQAGFLPLPGLGPHLTVRSVCPRAAPIEPYHWRSWRCSIGDLEIF